MKARERPVTRSYARRERDTPSPPRTEMAEEGEGEGGNREVSVGNKEIRLEDVSERHVRVPTPELMLAMLLKDPVVAEKYKSIQQGWEGVENVESGDGGGGGEFIATKKQPEPQPPPEKPPVPKNSPTKPCPPLVELTTPPEFHMTRPDNQPPFYSYPDPRISSSSQLQTHHPYPPNPYAHPYYPLPYPPPYPPRYYNLSQ